MKSNSPTHSALALCVLGAVSGGYSATADAFQLGQLQGASRLGEPLDAYINVLLSPREASNATLVSVIPDFAYRQDPVMNAALSNIRAELISNEYGHHYIKVSSPDALKLPLLAFRIKASNGDMTLIRSFTVSPRQALPVVVQRPTNVPQNSRSGPATSRSVVSPVVTQPAATIAANETSSFQGETYGPVKAGDTLWKIATRVAGNNAGAILNEIFALNPHAFINGDINKLKQGVTLSLPSSATTTETALASDTLPSESSIVAEEPIATTDLEAEQPVESSAARLDSFSTAVNSVSATVDSATVDSAPTPFEESIDSESVSAVQINTPENVSFSASTRSIDWRTENPALAERLNSLGEKYAALREKYATQQSGLDSESPSTVAPSPDVMVADSATNDSEAALAEEEQSASDASVENAEKTFSNLIADGEVAAGNETLSAATVEASRFQLPFWALGIVGLGLVGSGIALFVLRLQRKAALVKQEQLRKEKDQSLKQELAKKAKHRVTIEDEVGRMLDQQIDEEVEEAEKTLKLNPDEIFTATMDELEFDTEDQAEEVDGVEHRINDSIAHGRYHEAETLLKEAISNSPRNFSAKLRLAEVFYITERIPEFVEISQDIHENHRPEISDEDWRRVMRMGKMIAPDEPPFSGPQSIMGDASAG
ncbi:MAG: FimV/HubP family polar landmark protein [Pseudomonadota bacterium]